MIDTFLVAAHDPLNARVVGSFDSRVSGFKQRMQNALGTLGPLYPTIDLVVKRKITDYDLTWVSRMHYNNGNWKEDPIVLQNFLDTRNKKPAG